MENYGKSLNWESNNLIKKYLPLNINIFLRIIVFY